MSDTSASSSSTQTTSDSTQTTKSGDTATTQSGEGQAYGKQTVASENPTSAWDQVKNIDWGDQLDELKESAENPGKFKSGALVSETEEQQSTQPDTDAVKQASEANQQGTTSDATTDTTQQSATTT